MRTERLNEIEKYLKIIKKYIYIFTIFKAILSIK